MTLPLPLRLRLRALFCAVTVSLLRCCCRLCFSSCICVGVRDCCCCCCCYLWGACWTGWLLQHSQIHSHSSYVHTYTHAHIYVHIQGEKNTRVAQVFVRLDALVCMCMYIRVSAVYVCSVFNESTTKNGRNVFCFYPSVVDVGFFGRWPLLHTHLQIPTHTRHAHKLTPAALSILTFVKFSLFSACM